MNLPQTTMGRTYIVVIPHTVGPFSDIRACYAQIAAESPWLRVIPPEAFGEEMQRFAEHDVMFVHWAPSMLERGAIPMQRRALILPVYSEALDDDRNCMLPDHVRDWERFCSLRDCFDGVFAHTPWMAQRTSEGIGKPGFVLPVGYSPVMGNPAWSCEKHHVALFTGSMIHRRLEFVRKFANGLSLDLCAGVYGPALIERMNLSKVTLYIAHSCVQSYSTWRIWQAVCTSSALATEPGDWWPLEDELCIPLPRLTQGNIDGVIDMVRTLPFNDAIERARALRASLEKFTTRYCVENYMIDRTRGLSR